MTRSKDARVISPAAELDLATAPHLGAEVIEQLARGERRLVLDLTGVRLIDSAGIGVLLSIQRRVLQSGGELTLAQPSDHVRHVLALTGVDRTLKVETAPSG